MYLINLSAPLVSDKRICDDPLHVVSMDLCFHRSQGESFDLSRAV